MRYLLFMQVLLDFFWTSRLSGAWALHPRPRTQSSTRSTTWVHTGRVMIILFVVVYRLSVEWIGWVIDGSVWVFIDWLNIGLVECLMIGWKWTKIYFFAWFGSDWVEWWMKAFGLLIYWLVDWWTEELRVGWFIYCLRALRRGQKATIILRSNLLRAALLLTTSRRSFDVLKWDRHPHGSLCFLFPLLSLLPCPVPRVYHWILFVQQQCYVAAGRVYRGEHHRGLHLLGREDRGTALCYTVAVNALWFLRDEGSFLYHKRGNL